MNLKGKSLLVFGSRTLDDGRIEEALATFVEQNIRTALRSLKTVGNLTIKPTNKFSLITVVNWGAYQGEEVEPNQQVTSNQPASNQQLTTNKNGKNGKKGIRRVQKPSIEELQVYFTDQGCPATEARKFYDYYESKAGGMHEYRSMKALEIADHMLAFWDGKSKGTKNEIEMAEKLGVPTTVVKLDNELDLTSLDITFEDEDF